jgi:hypothetical protein
MSITNPLGEKLSLTSDIQSGVYFQKIIATTKIFINMCNKMVGAQKKRKTNSITQVIVLCG